MVSQERKLRKRKREAYFKKKEQPSCKLRKLNEETNVEKKNVISHEETHSEIMLSQRHRNQKKARTWYYKNKITLLKKSKCQVKKVKAEVEKAKYARDPTRKKMAEKARYARDPTKKKAAEKAKYARDPTTKKAAEKAKYKRDPTTKKAAEKAKYAKDPSTKKAAEKSKYAKNPTKKKAAENTKYARDPITRKAAEKKRYARDPTTKKAAEKKKYARDPTTKKAAEKAKYAKDPSTKKAVVKARYVLDPTRKKQTERARYADNPANKIYAEKIKYKKNAFVIKEKRRSRYYIESELMKAKRDSNFKLNYRLRKLRWAQETLSGAQKTKKHSKRKHGLRIKNSGNIRRNLFNLNWLNSDRCAREIANKTKGGIHCKKILQSREIVKWCIYAHKLHKKEFCKNFSSLRSDFLATLNKIELINDPSKKLKLICGNSLHTSATEPYLYEFSYKLFCNKDKKIVIDDQMRAANIFIPVSGGSEKHKEAWKCSGDVCNINSNTVSRRLETLLKLVSSLNLRKGAEFAVGLNKCSNPCSKEKMHSLDCYTTEKCSSYLPYLRALSPHFPQIRKYVRAMYHIKRRAKKMLHIKNALDKSDLKSLLEIADAVKKDANIFSKEETSRPQVSESEIISAYPKAFLALEKKSGDLAINPCVSCEKLYSERQVRSLPNLRKGIESAWWSDLSEIKPMETKLGKICQGCLEKFREGKLPATCILNGLYTSLLPDAIKSLNEFEKILIQRAKAFQVVTRMGTVASRQVPNNKKVQKVKGMTFHLPLPLEETLKKLPNPKDPINRSTELYVSVRGIPTKRKIVWESLVNINKIYAALRYLKENNELYRDILLPYNPESLWDAIDEDEGTVSFLQEEMEDKKALTTRKALLTQVPSEEWNAQSVQYTIHALHEPKSNETACGLYKMLRVTEGPIDPWEKKIDLLCFPDLFTSGKFGQFHERSVKLTSSEFIKSRLLSKHSRYRLNQQFLFYLLHDANIRQLRQGIFHKMNVVYFGGRLTAGECLKNISDGNLECELTTIFAKLRNTPQFWVQPRNDVQCMTSNYGPATWFLTMSPSEWNWDDLGNFISQVNPKIEKSAKKSTSELVALDPVSASRFIENKFQGMLQFLMSEDNPLGPVNHYFYRREYQTRGLQHFHLLLWVENAPILGESDNREVAEFISKYVTCQVPISDLSPTLYDRVTKYQTHVHNSYCLRNKKTGKDTFRKVCRFGFPRQVTEELVLRDIIHAVAGRKALKRNGRLYDLPRSLNEQYINDYNPVILMAWDGNIDLQFVGEKTNILNWYVTKYTTKSETSHLGEIFNDMNTNKSLYSRLFNIGIRALNHRECGALEASDTLLGIPLYGTDPDTTIRWLDVNMIRKKRLQPMSTIKHLDEQSTEIFFESWVDNYYPNRHEDLELMTLYDFVRWFDVRKFPLKGNRETYTMSNNKYLVKRFKPYLINHYKHSFKQSPEKYYYSLLLMFKPWRNTIQLKGHFETYMESFNFHKEDLLQAQQYDTKLKEIELAIERTKELIQIKTSEFEKEGGTDKEIVDNAFAFQVKEAEITMRDMQIAANINALNDKTEDELSIDEVYNELNLDQKRVFDFVTGRICNHDGKQKVLRHFVSGVGGTGKSHLIKAIRLWTKQKHQTFTAVSAPTGLSAYSINGMTIYKLFQLPVEHGRTPKFRPVSDEVLKMMRCEMKNISLFIIDEISMVSNLTLIYIHLRLSEIFATSDVDDGWFGGKHIILFGDLLQLPPVHEESPFEDISKDSLAKYVGSLSVVNLWNELFSYDELVINMRQADDVHYAQLLSRIRVGTISTKDIDELNKRKIPLITANSFDRVKEIGSYLIDLPMDTVCLCATGRLCFQLNKEMLSRLEGEEINLVAKDTVECKPYMRGKLEKVLNNYDSDCTRTAGMEKLITVKVGAKVMLRRNINVAIGLVNSAIGVITDIKRSLDVPLEIDKLTIQFNNNVVHDLERMSTKFEIMDKTYVYRDQFPISISYGITIHKSQGLSLNTALIDIGESVFTCGQSYVALSRVKSLVGLHLINFNPASVKAQSSAITQYNRLRSLFRADLPLFPTNIAADKNPRIKDRKWSPLKEFDLVQGNFDKKKKSSGKKDFKRPSQLNIHGFLNSGNFCYANAVVQCVYSSWAVRNIIKNEVSVPMAIKSNLTSYEMQVEGLDTKEVRHVVDQTVFGGPEQQDCVEFLEALLNSIVSLRDLALYSQSHTTICQHCGYSNVVNTEETVVRLALSGKKTSLEELFALQFGRWCGTDESFRCSNCCTMGEAKQKYEVLTASEVIILQILAFDNMQMKKSVNLNGVPKSKLLIDGKVYTPIAGIFHYGQSLTEGHYKAYLKRGQKWICANDAETSEKRWPPSAKDLYVLLLSQFNPRTEI